jgi:MFS family permease
VGFLFAYTGLLGIIIQGGLLGKLVKRLGEERVVFYAFASAIIGYVFLGFARTLPFLLVSATFASLGSGGLRPSLTALISRQAGAHEQGRIMGLIQGINSVASIIGPIIAGLLIDQGWLGAWAGIMCVFSVWGLALIWRTLSATKKAALA